MANIVICAATSRWPRPRAWRRRNCFLLEDGEAADLERGPYGPSRARGRGRTDPDRRRRIRRPGVAERAAHAGTRRHRVRGDRGVVEDGAIIAGPELISRGLMIGDGTSAHIRRARAQLAERLNRVEGPFSAEGTMLREEIVHTLRTTSASARQTAANRAARHGGLSAIARQPKAPMELESAAATIELPPAPAPKPRRARLAAIVLVALAVRRAEPGFRRGRSDPEPVRHSGRGGAATRRPVRISGLRAGAHGAGARDAGMEWRAGPHADARASRRSSPADCAQRRRGPFARERRRRRRAERSAPRSRPRWERYLNVGGGYLCVMLAVIAALVMMLQRAPTELMAGLA